MRVEIWALVLQASRQLVLGIPPCLFKEPMVEVFAFILGLLNMGACMLILLERIYNQLAQYLLCFWLTAPNAPASRRLEA